VVPLNQVENVCIEGETSNCTISGGGPFDLLTYRFVMEKETCFLFADARSHTATQTSHFGKEVSTDEE